jgi:long-chain fatty acid transport protein
MRLPISLLAVALLLFSMAPAAFGQTYGVELHNSLMPASGGMAGASYTQPQDLQSAI